MKKSFFSILLVFLGMMLSSFQSCTEDLVEIYVSNESTDTIYVAVCRGENDLLEETNSRMLLLYFQELRPGNTCNAFAGYTEQKEKDTWVMWTINKRQLRELTIIDVFEKKLLEEVDARCDTLTYLKLAAEGFVVKVR